MSAPVEIAAGVYRLETMRSFVNSYAFLNSDGSVTLVDCGYRSAPPRLVKHLAHLGKHPSDVTSIVLTHAHDDHVGGAAEMIRQTGAATVMMHEQDAGYPSSGRTPTSDTATLSGRLLAALPARHYTPFHVTRQLTEGDVIEAAGGLRVLHTPGHTDGHISLLHLPTSTLITGDSIFNMTSRLTWGLSGFCVDYQQSRQTAQRFLDVDFATAAFTHGPEIRGQGKQRITQFLSRRGLS